MRIREGSTTERERTAESYLYVLSGDGEVIFDTEASDATTRVDMQFALEKTADDNGFVCLSVRYRVSSAS